jgi:hypothetical protein
MSRGAAVVQFCGNIVVSARGVAKCVRPATAICNTNCISGASGGIGALEGGIAKDWQMPQLYCP